MVREPLRPRRRGPRRELAALHEPAALRRRRRRGCASCSAPRPGWSTWSATRSTGCSPTTCTTSAAATSRGRWRRRSPTRIRLRRPQPLRDAGSSPTWRRSARERRAGGRPRGPRRRRATRRCAPCSSSAGVDPAFRSQQFEREWETGSGKQDGGFRLMDRAVRLPGLRALDRNFDRLPESLRWLVERVVHDPGRRRGAEAADLRLPARHAELPSRGRHGAAGGDRRPRVRLELNVGGRGEYDPPLPIESRVSRWGTTHA